MFRMTFRWQAYLCLAMLLVCQVLQMASIRTVFSSYSSRTMSISSVQRVTLHSVGKSSLSLDILKQSSQVIFMPSATQYGQHRHYILGCSCVLNVINTVFSVLIHFRTGMNALSFGVSRSKIKVTACPRAQQIETYKCRVQCCFLFPVCIHFCCC